MNTQITHLSREELDAGLHEIRRSPKDQGTLDLIVRRPGENQREELDAGRLLFSDGLEGDSWKSRGSSRTENGTPHPDMQLNIMNSRVIQLISRDKDRWKLAGDQLFVDLDLSAENLPPGTRLSIGTSIIEVTPQPHTGCGKFVDRFGLDAMKFVNSKQTRHLHLRGINARVIQEGTIQTGDTITKL